MARKKQWMLKPLARRPELPDEVEKQAIITACEAFIGEVLKPRFLPECGFRADRARHSDLMPPTIPI